MKISELISELQKFPGDLVFLIDASGQIEGYAEAGPPREQYAIRKTIGGRYEVTEWDDSPDPIEPEQVERARIGNKSLDRLKVVIL